MRPADQHAAGVVSGHLIDMRKKEQPRELFAASACSDKDVDLQVVAEKLASVVGLDYETALSYLMEFSASRA